MIHDSNTAVIVLNWNGEDVIRDCLESLRSLTRAANIIIVDNALLTFILQLLNFFPLCRFITYSERL